jgi:hypothetical protein
MEERDDWLVSHVLRYLLLTDGHRLVNLSSASLSSIYGREMNG